MISEIATEILGCCRVYCESIVGRNISKSSVFITVSSEDGCIAFVRTAGLVFAESAVRQEEAAIVGKGRKHGHIGECRGISRTVLIAQHRERALRAQAVMAESFLIGSPQRFRSGKSRYGIALQRFRQ